MGKLTKGILLAIGLGLVLASCSSSAQPTPTLIPIVPEQVIEAATEDYFWMIAESQNIPRSASFKDAKLMLNTLLLNTWDFYLTQIEQFGKDPFTTMPYCITAIGVGLYTAKLGLSETPADAAGYADSAILLLKDMDVDVLAAQTGAGYYSPQQCNEIENEFREYLGMTLIGQ